MGYEGRPVALRQPPPQRRRQPVAGYGAAGAGTRRCRAQGRREEIRAEGPACCCRHRRVSGSVLTAHT